MSKKISELNIRETLTGNELIPFAENEENGAFKSGVLIDEMHSILTDIEDSEQGRVLAEQGRVNAESARASAETQRASEWLTLKGKAETATEHAEAAAQSVEAVTDRIDALEQGKADKDGSYDAMTVGLAKGLLPSSGVENEASWTERLTASTGSFSGGDRNVEDGLAALRSIKGFTVKNLVKNGNFENGLEGWTSFRDNADFDFSNPDYMEIQMHPRDQYCGIWQSFSMVANHKYHLSYRAWSDKDMTFGLDAPSNLKVPQLSEEWKGVFKLFTLSANKETFSLYSAKITDDVNVRIDRHYGVRLYDLTEMGIANLFTGSDAAERYTELFDRYTEGVEGASTEAIHTTGANAFDVSMRIVGKAIGEDGAIVDDESKALLQVPVLKSKTGVGCNNGYRIHGIVAERIGWNPFAIDDSRFDCAYDVTEPNADDADYSANDRGYLLVQVEASADVSSVVVHPRWSYSEQFDSEWYAKHQDERMGSLAVPQSYIDAEGHVQSIGALHGLTNGTTWWRDEIDLAKGKYVKRVDKFFYTPEWIARVACQKWTTYGGYAFYIRDAEMRRRVSNRNNTAGLASNYYQISITNFFGNITDKVFTPLTAGLYNDNIFTIHDNKYVRDSSGTAFTLSSDNVGQIDSEKTIEAFRAYLTSLYNAGTPLTFYYVLATPEVYDLAESDYHVEYPICDFGIERVEGEGATSQLTTAYLPNYTDVIRNAASKGEVASLTERVQALEQLIAPLATSNLNDTTDELAD